MLEKFINVIKEKYFNLPAILLYNYKELNINSSDLIVLIYLLNNNSTFNPKEISEKLQIEMSEVLEIISHLTEKDIIKIELKKINGIREEFVNLDSLYKKLALIIIKDEEPALEKITTIFDIFEKEFGRTLSPIEYQIINGWKEMNYSEDIIVKALKEAVYNGVSNLRYIDKILYEWNKKGIRSSMDIDKKTSTLKTIDKDVLEYDWLNDD